MRRLSAIGLICPVLVFAAASGAFAQYDITPLTDNTYDDQAPDLNEHGYVVWAAHDGSDYEIFLYDGTATIPITNNDYDDSGPRVNAAGSVVWSACDNGLGPTCSGGDVEIFLYDGTRTTQLTDNTDHDNDPRINEAGTVVWRGCDGGLDWTCAGGDWEIFLYDGVGTTRLTDNAYSDLFAGINKAGVVVWQGWDGSDDEIFLYDGVGTTQLTDNASADIGPRIQDNGTVVWAGHDGSDYEVFLYDGVTTTQLTSNAFDDREPRINKTGFVVWQGWDAPDSEIFLYDGAGTIRLTDNDYDDGSHRINDSGYVVWDADDGTGRDIYLYDGVGTSRITNSPSIDRYPGINKQGFLVWQGQVGTDFEIFLAKPRAAYSSVQLTGNRYHDFVTDMNNDQYVVWNGNDGSDEEIFLYDGMGVTQLTNNPYDEYDPRINVKGDMVWSGFDGSDREIFVYNGTTTTQLTNNSYDDDSPRISYSGVVWRGWDGADWEIYLYDGVGTTQITNDAYDDFEPRINFHGHVVWRADDGSDYEIFLDRGTGAIQLTDNTTDDYDPRINDIGYVAWRGYAGVETDIFLYDGVSNKRLGNPGFSDRDHRMNRDGHVVWHGTDGSDYEIFLYDGLSTTRITNNATYDQYPRINDNDVIVWTGCDGGTGNDCAGGDWEVFLYDGSLKRVTNNDRMDWSPLINDNGFVAYAGCDGANCMGGDGDFEIFLSGLCMDVDGDGYGDPASPTCAYPDWDCDDTNPDVNPGALEGPFGGPVCSDGLDNDCDERTDRLDPGCVDRDVWYVDVNAAGPGTGAPGEPFRKIQDALGIADEGDRVLVADGLYREHLVWSDAAGIELSSRSGNPGACILEALKPTLPVISGQFDSDRSITIQGMTIRGGSEGIHFLFDVPALAHEVKILDNWIEGNTNHGIRIDSVVGGSAIISENLIFSNGIGVELNKLDVIFTGNRVRTNTEQGVILGAVSDQREARVNDNRIYNNGQSLPGSYGILITAAGEEYYGTVEMMNNVIYGNDTEYGACIEAGFSTVEVSSNRVYDHTDPVTRAGLLVRRVAQPGVALIEVMNNTVYGNPRAAGIEVMDEGSGLAGVFVMNNRATGNDTGIALVRGADTVAQLKNNTVADNLTTGFELAGDPEGLVDLCNMIFWDNGTDDIFVDDPIGYTLRFSDVEDMGGENEGEGVLHEDPILRGVDRYDLDTSSPCRGTGIWSDGTLGADMGHTGGEEGYNTYLGQAVPVELEAEGVRVEFTDVTGSGRTWAYSGAGVPGAYTLEGAPQFWDISTDAEYSGSVRICLAYEESWFSGIPDFDENEIVIMHRSGVEEEFVPLENIVVDTEANIVCGDSPAGLSVFALAHPLCFDEDGDGFGFPASEDCLYPAEDCDDSDPEIHPGHPEVADNGKDDNCDGEIDEEVGCFIATAAFGTADERRLDILRAFRDRVLERSEFGRRLVDAYYATSPPVAEVVSGHAWLKAVVRTLLLPLIGLASLCL